jgi:hypothetical protein
MQPFTQNLKIESRKLRDLELGKEYRIAVYMYYKINLINEVRVYMKYIKVSRIETEGVLIAEFANNEIVIKANSNMIAVVDASLSKDNGNISNTNFSYSWECSSNFP